MERQKNILLCVAGGTPAIITETLWALKERDERVDEIRVITTLEGREKVKNLLLDAERGKFHQFLRDYPEVGEVKFDEHRLYLLSRKNIGLPSEFDWDEDRLTDILSDADNECAANQICEVVREITKDEGVRLHASVAGGRKTMGLYLMAAMQLFGRTHDVMSHVLVSKEVENNRFFFYKPPTPETVLIEDRETKQIAPLLKLDGSEYTTADAEIYLAKIPFIRLRGNGVKFFDEKVKSYKEAVDKAQSDLEWMEANYNVRLDMKRCAVKVGQRVAELSDREFFVYALFARLRREGRGDDGFMSPDAVNLREFDAVCRMISHARLGEELGIENFDVLRGAALHSLNVQLYQKDHPRRSEAEAGSDVRKTMGEVVSRIKTNLKKANISEDFAIVNLNKHKKNVDALYGLRIEPERIKFE